VLTKKSNHFLSAISNAKTNDYGFSNADVTDTMAGTGQQLVVEHYLARLITCFICYHLHNV